MLRKAGNTGRCIKMAERKIKQKLKIINLRCPAVENPDIAGMLVHEYGFIKEDIKGIEIVRRSIDARKDVIFFVYTLIAEIFSLDSVVDKLVISPNLKRYIEDSKRFIRKIVKLKNRPVIVGCGPAGLFAALTLIERGAAPLIIERGERISKRAASVNKFIQSAELNTESNIFYGEGGAGTFSDGKLTTRIKSNLKDRVLKELIAAGADSSISFIQRPHLGTDCLRKIIPNIVDKLISKGAEFIFEKKVDDILIENGQVKGLKAGNDLIETENIFIATGHSSFELYKMLLRNGVSIEPKGFAVGFRIEHPREFIDRCQQGKFAGNKLLGAAEYTLTYKDQQTNKGVYSFCMCPGGYVVGCSSRLGSLCTNGMSKYARDNAFSNAAIVVTVSPEDLSGSDPFKGFSFIHKLEETAYKLGGGSFTAPVQTAYDFINSNVSQKLIKDSSYRPKVKSTDLNLCFEDKFSAILKRGLINFNKKIPGFIEEGVLFGVETRTSSPVRIARDIINYNAVGVKGLIPIGEVSGYAGGIMSCAVDGIKAADSFC